MTNEMYLFIALSEFNLFNTNVSLNEIDFTIDYNTETSKLKDLINYQINGCLN